MTHTTATLGYPRIGRNRDTKKAVEKYWANIVSEAALNAISETVLVDAIDTQAAAGIDRIAVGDHTLYDHILDWTMLLGCVPQRFEHLTGLDCYFAMARGIEGGEALDMSKWFGTNYHYLVPELDGNMKPKANLVGYLKQIDKGIERVGVERVVPNIVGPVTYVHVAHLRDVTKEEMIKRILPVYHELFRELKKRGVKEVQIHEPALVLGKAAELKPLYILAFQSLAMGGLPMDLVTFFDSIDADVFDWVKDLPGLCAISLDFTRGDNLGTLKKVSFPTGLRLGAGVVDGRSVWGDNATGNKLLEEVKGVVGPGINISVQPSCSLQYVPIDVEMEIDLPQDVKPFLSFAVQKLNTVASIARGEDNSDLKDIVKETVANVLDEELFTRTPVFEERRSKQYSVQGGYGTTTIGSFPQTKELRRLHTLHRKGVIGDEEYEKEVDKQIAYVIGIQEALGLDVFVHGEPERTDMVEYFGVKLEGFAFTTHGWVQSYGNRCVRPPIVVGDVKRTGKMTVREFVSAQKMTEKPVKGMLTGATTILNWSFGRKDISREAQAYQIGLALRGEVIDLEAAGCRIIQVDDPALREGLPLKEKDWGDYLRWAVRSFRLSTAGVKAETQIVTHLCYSEFEDILEAIDDMDADVLTIENSRSGDAMLKALASYGYARDIGPGVYDIHSPVVPKVGIMEDRIKLFEECGLKKEQIWVNPDCGLKTRKWAEVLPSLANMVESAATARAK